MIDGGSAVQQARAAVAAPAAEPRHQAGDGQAGDGEGFNRPAHERDHSVSTPAAVIR